MKEKIWEEWLGFPAMRMVDGRFPLPDKPGLGFDLTEEALAKYPFGGTRPMARVFAPDGSRGVVKRSSGFDQDFGFTNASPSGVRRQAKYSSRTLSASALGTGPGVRRLLEPHRRGVRVAEGRPLRYALPVGSPCLAKFVQYVAMASEIT